MHRDSRYGERGDCIRLSRLLPVAPSQRAAAMPRADTEADVGGERARARAGARAPPTSCVCSGDARLARRLAVYVSALAVYLAADACAPTLRAAAARGEEGGGLVTKRQRRGPTDGAGLRKRLDQGGGWAGPLRVLCGSSAGPLRVLCGSSAGALG